jgi:hypothetical protein
MTNRIGLTKLLLFEGYTQEQVEKSLDALKQDAFLDAKRKGYTSKNEEKNKAQAENWFATVKKCEDFIVSQMD